MDYKEIKSQLAHCRQIESMLLGLLIDPACTNEEARMIVEKIFEASEFILRFETCLKEMKTMNNDKYKKGE